MSDAGLSSKASCTIGPPPVVAELVCLLRSALRQNEMAHDALAMFRQRAFQAIGKLEQQYPELLEK
jgi:hypothetical protein